MNPGERVEGTSSLPWAFVLAAFARLGARPEDAAPVLGVLGALAVVAGAYRLAYALAGQAAARAGAWMAALAAPLAIWGASGMETPLYAAVLGTWLWLLAGPGAPVVAAGLTAGLAAVLRPEGAVLAALPALARRPWVARQARRAALGAGIVVVPFAMFRIAYFGDWVANPVHAKSPGWAALAPGALYTAKVAVSYALVLGLAWRGLRRAVTRGARVAAAAVVAQAVFMIAAGGDHFAGARFLVPALVPLAALAGAGVAGPGSRSRRGLAAACAAAGLVLTFGAVHLVPVAEPLVGLARLHLPAAAHADRIASEVRHVGVVLVGLAIWFACAASARARGHGPALVLAGLTAFAPQAWDPQVSSCRHPDGASVYGRAVGGWLAKAVPPGTLVATNAAGALPYASGLPVIDMLGLADRTIARSRPDVRQWVGHERGDGAYVLRRSPDLIVLGGAEGSLEPWPFPGDQQLFAAPEFHARYTPLRARVEGPVPGGFDFSFYCRNDRCDALRRAGAVDVTAVGP